MKFVVWHTGTGWRWHLAQGKRVYARSVTSFNSSEEAEKEAEKICLELDIDTRVEVET